MSSPIRGGSIINNNHGRFKLFGQTALPQIYGAPYPEEYFSGSGNLGPHGWKNRSVLKTGRLNRRRGNGDHDGRTASAFYLLPKYRLLCETRHPFSNTVCLRPVFALSDLSQVLFLHNVACAQKNMMQNIAKMLSPVPTVHGCYRQTDRRICHYIDRM